MAKIILIIILAGSAFAGYQYLEKQKQAEAQRQHEAALKAEKLRKEQEEAAFNNAFESWYQPIKGCDVPTSGPLRVTCINDRIRAKREFKDIYQAE